MDDATCDALYPTCGNSECGSSGSIEVFGIVGCVGQPFHTDVPVQVVDDFFIRIRPGDVEKHAGRMTDEHVAPLALSRTCRSVEGSLGTDSHDIPSGDFTDGVSQNPAVALGEVVHISRRECESHARLEVRLDICHIYNLVREYTIVKLHQKLIKLHSVGDDPVGASRLCGEGVCHFDIDIVGENFRDDRFAETLDVELESYNDIRCRPFLNRV